MLAAKHSLKRGLSTPTLQEKSFHILGELELKNSFENLKNGYFLNHPMKQNSKIYVVDVKMDVSILPSQERFKIHIRAWRYTDYLTNLIDR